MPKVRPTIYRTMSLKITFPGKGKVKDTVYTVRDFDELTLSDYRRLTAVEVVDFERDLDAMYSLVQAYTGIGEKKLNTRPMAEVQAVFDHVLAEVAKAIEVSRAFASKVEADDSYVPPDTVNIGGVSYRVPKDLELDTVAGQWADWMRWDPPTHEADLVIEALAFLLVEDGKAYQGTSKEKHEAISECPITLGFDLCAFFFAKSERFRSVTSRRRISFRESLNALVGKVLNVSRTDIEGSIGSTVLPN